VPVDHVTGKFLIARPQARRSFTWKRVDVVDELKTDANAAPQ